jgi:hypothetical protein
MTTESPPPERSGSGAVHRSPEPSSSWWPVLAPAVALGVGLLIGGAVVGVADDDEAPSTTPAPASSSTLDDPTGAPSEGETTIVVPDACLAAVDTVEEATQLTRDGAAAIRDFEPAELRALLTELEELDQQAREQARACRDADVQ